MTKTICQIMLISACLITSACAHDITESARRKSETFYQAAYVAWFDEGDTLRAIRHLTRSTTENPQNVNAQYLLGTLRLGRLEIEAAEKHLRLALQHCGEDRPSTKVKVQNSLGVLLIHKKEYVEAVALLEAAVGEVLNGEPWLAMGNLGWAYTELGEYDKAIDMLKRAMFDQQKFCVGRYRLGNVYYKKGEYNLAKANLDAIMEMGESACEKMPVVFHLLGMTLLRLDDVEAAREAFETCRDLDPAGELGNECAQTLSGL